MWNFPAKNIPFWGDLTMWLYFPAKNLSHSEGTWLCDCILSQWNLTHSEGTWLCDYTFQPKIYPILRGPDYVIILSSQKSIPFWGDLTMWLYFPSQKIYPILRGPDYVIMFPKQWSLSHSEGTWLCDYTFQPKIYPILRGPDYVIILPAKNLSILRGPDYVIILSSQKSIPFWGDLTMWLYFQPKSLSHSEGTWLCDYTFQPKNLSHSEGTWLCDCTKAKNLSHSEGTWLCDYTFQPKTYPILRGPDYVIILSSQKSIPFWGDLTMWLYFPAKKSIPFWGDLTMWLYFPAKNLSHSEGTWLCDCVLRNEIYDILRGPDYVIILSS